MSGTLHLCQAKINHGPRGRKNDFADGERMIKRLVAQELVLSFVPDPEQRLWRTVTRRKHQLTRAKVSFKNQLESLLEQAHIKLSSFVSDLLGVSARRMLKALAEGETDPAVLAALADRRLRATPEQLRDALGACAQLNGVYRRLLKMALEELQLIEDAHRASWIGRPWTYCREHQDAGATRGGSARIRSGFGDADDRRSGTAGSDFRFGEGIVFVGGSVSRERRERGRITEHALAEGQSSDAAAC